MAMNYPQKLFLVKGAAWETTNNGNDCGGSKGIYWEWVSFDEIAVASSPEEAEASVVNKKRQKIEEEIRSLTATVEKHNSEGHENLPRSKIDYTKCTACGWSFVHVSPPRDVDYVYAKATEIKVPGQKITVESA